ncbi:hypothetical protein ACP4OV_012982 [Aristida adscensionis]
MAMARSLAPVLLLITFFCCYGSIPSLASSDDFLQCLSANIPNQHLYTQSSSTFTSVLVSYIRNPKFSTRTMVKPLCIITPTNASQVQATVICGRRHGVRLRVRSGGHDYEGLSYRSVRPEEFAVVDMANLRAVRINRKTSTAWVDSGATLGELYYAIGKTSSRLAFSAGICPTVGVGGHFSGGGFGMMLRKYGAAIDSVVDAVLVDAHGRLLDRKAMGSDVFWALRGGGGESFGVVLSWRVKLAPVPAKVTVFTVPVSVDRGAVDIVTKWQQVGPALPADLQVRVLVQKQVASFQALFLGTCDALMPTMRRRLPELGMNRTHCREMPWIQTVPYFYPGGNATVEDIVSRTDTSSYSTAFKGTSDYVREPIARDVWEEIFKRLAPPDAGLMILAPYGAGIGGVPASATPYPHRGGVLYNIQYMNFWSTARGDDGTAHTEWVRGMYAFMEPHVSKNPRQAYFNFRDLDLGQNVVVSNVSSYEAGKVWGEKYFMDNYHRLALAKGQIDPDDYFRNEQSIPPLVPRNW